uniref:Neuritin 1 n=1 Tax=Anas platyrhynchos platyrhynchos TaxID=8840 RepID=A0A493T4L3_ANAPP
MGLKLNGRYISLILAVQIAYLVQAVRAAGRCDAVFRGFSDCLLRLGDNMANYPQDLDDKRNLQTICAYWDDFHACTLTALTDCQEGATDLWEKLRRESKNLDFQGSLFELCGGGSGSVGRPSDLAAFLGGRAHPHPHPLHVPDLSRKCPSLALGTLCFSVVDDGGGG